MWERFAGADTTECFPPSQARGDRAAQLCEGHAMSDAILLQADGDSAEILPFGAELSAWRADGVDLVWAKDPKIWDQTAPVLFPVVGWTRDAQVTVAGRNTRWPCMASPGRNVSRSPSSRPIICGSCYSRTPRRTRSIPSPSAS